MNYILRLSSITVSTRQLNEVPDVEKYRELEKQIEISYPNDEPHWHAVYKDILGCMSFKEHVSVKSIKT